MAARKTWVADLEVSKSRVESEEGMRIPSPPIRRGSENSCLSRLLQS